MEHKLTPEELKSLMDAVAKTGTVEKYPVSKRALIQRINRQLAKKGQHLRTSRSNGEKNNLGAFYIVDQNTVIALYYSAEDLVDLAKALEVWGGWEELAKEDDAE